MVNQVHILHSYSSVSDMTKGLVLLILLNSLMKVVSKPYFLLIREYAIVDSVESENFAFPSYQSPSTFPPILQGAILTCGLFLILLTFPDLASVLK